MAICNECGLPIQRLGGFTRVDVQAHQRTCGHNPNAPYSCPGCGWKSNPRHTFDPSKCRNCGKPILKDSREEYSNAEMVQPELEPEESKPVTSEFSESKVETPEKPKKKVFRWSEQK